jgi:hypothetical protein
MVTTADFKETLQTGMGWLFPALYLAAAIICFTASRVSSRVSLLGIGFLLQALAGLANRLVFYFLVRSSNRPDFETIGLIQLGLGILNLIALLLVVLGLILFFVDVRQRLSRAGPRDDYGPPRSREPDEDRPWRARQDGSLDIQT